MPCSVSCLTGDVCGDRPRAAMPAARALFVAAVLALAMGCSSREVIVTAFRSRAVPFPPAEGRTRIAVAAHTAPSDELFAEEIRRKVEILLEQRGYVVAPLGDATHVLQVSFSSGPGRTVTHCVEHYVPGWSVTRVYRHRGREVYVRDCYPGRWERHRYRTTSYTRNLEMVLYERGPGRRAGSEGGPARGKGRHAVAWRVSTRITGGDPDPRRAADYLLVAAFDYFGADTGERVRDSLSGRDARVEELREAARP